MDVVLRPGRPEAAAEIWNWRESAVGEPEDETRRATGKVRLKGCLQGLIGGSLGALVYHYWSQSLGTVMMSFAGLIFSIALLSPRLIYGALDRLFVWTGERVSGGVMWLTLNLLFYLVFAPFGKLFRRGRRDKMLRFFEPERASYWTPYRLGDPAPGSSEKLY